MGKTCTFFCGAGGACAGLELAGWDVIWGNEYDPYIASIWKANHAKTTLDTRSILDLSIADIPDADLYWFSPPCPEYSKAKTNRKGGTALEDTSIAEMIVKIIEAKKPRFISIENVENYANSTSLRIIKIALDSAGYLHNQQIVNSADYGSPQTRRRFILLAQREATPPSLVRSHSKHGEADTSVWAGWHSSIADLLPGLKPTTLTNNQMINLAKKSKATLSLNAEAEEMVIIQRLGYNMATGNQLRKATQPIWTITASACADGNKDRNGNPYYRSAATVALIKEGNISAWRVDRRCWARFQDFPDTHIWGSIESLNCKAIGNAVPVQLAKAIGKALLRAI